MVSMIIPDPENKGKELSIPLRDVRGSVSWPTPHASMYFAIFAQKQEFGYTPKPPVVLVTEYMNQAPMECFRQMVELGRQYACHQFYADLRPRNEEIVDLFDEYSRYHQSRSIILEFADLAGDFQFGLGIVKDWAKSLEIPKGTILRNELSSVTPQNMEASRPEESYPAINALRLLLASLEKNPWTAPRYVPIADPDRSRRKWSVYT